MEQRILEMFPIYRSKNLVKLGVIRVQLFTDATRPTWGGDHNIWAPEIRYFNNHYVLYYSWAIWGR
ncbi:family 43 glycosylhydrolase [Bacteroides ovatus]|nr:family 43 glycosylhydrolase [Bacteroides ovatus]